jgi:hypothetical protein
MARRLTVLMLLTSVRLAPAIAQAAEPVSSCPSFKALGLRLDQRIAGLTT